MTSSSATLAVLTATKLRPSSISAASGVQQPRDEHDVTVEPQHATRWRQPQCLEQALGGAGLVVQLVVDECGVSRGGLHDEVHLEADHDGDVRGVAERVAQVVELLAEDAAPVDQRRQRLRMGTAETGAEAGGQDHHVDRHVGKFPSAIHPRADQGRIARTWCHQLVGSGLPSAYPAALCTPTTACSCNSARCGTGVRARAAHPGDHRVEDVLHPGRRGSRYIREVEMPSSNSAFRARS